MQEVEAVEPAVIVPAVSVPTRVGLPPVMHAPRVGAGLPVPVERMWPGKYTPLLASTPNAPVVSCDN